MLYIVLFGGVVDWLVGEGMIGVVGVVFWVMIDFLKVFYV